MTDNSQAPTHNQVMNHNITNHQKTTQKVNQKLWLLVGGVIILLLVGGSAGLLIKNKLTSSQTKAPSPTPTKKVLEPVNLIEIDKRPFISLKPKADGHNLTIEIATLPQPAESIEYELEYQTGSMLQGAFGEVELDNLPVKEEVFLGSCSAGGACTYHQDIKGGSVLTRFKSNTGNYALKSDFRWWEKNRDDNKFASRDAKFQLQSDDLAKNSYVIIFNGAGLPDMDQLEGELASDIYVIGANTSLKGKASGLKIRAKDDQAEKIAYWSKGDGWQYLKATKNPENKKELQVENAPLAQVYLAVK